MLGSRYQLLPLLILLAALFGSCRELKDLELTGVRGFRVNRINMAGIDGDIMLSVKNPNRFGFTIYKSEFDVKYSGVYLGKAKLGKKVRIKGNTEEVYTFNVNSDLSHTNLLDVIKLLKGASFKNELEIKGDLKAGKFLIRKPIPVDLRERISLQ